MLATLLLVATGASSSGNNCTCGNSTDDGSGSSGLYSLSSFSWWGCLLLAVFCVLLSAFAAGANMGVMSLSVLELKLLAEVSRRGGDDDNNGPSHKRRSIAADGNNNNNNNNMSFGEHGEGRDDVLEAAQCARRVLPLVRRKHLVLVTLLLITALADEVLPLCINAIAPTWVAVVTSVFFMLVFTEIIPTAIFTDTRVNLRLTSALAPFVWLLMFAVGLLTLPVAMVLKCLIDRRYGHDTNSDEAPYASHGGGEGRKSGVSPMKVGVDAKAQHQQQPPPANDPVGSLLRPVKLKALVRLLTKLAPEASSTVRLPARRDSASAAPSANSTPFASAAGAPLSPAFPSTPPLGPSGPRFQTAPAMVTKNQLMMTERVLDLPLLRLRDVATPLSALQLGEKFCAETSHEAMLIQLALWAADRAPWCLHNTTLLRIRRLVALLSTPGAPFMGQGRHLLDLAASETFSSSEQHHAAATLTLEEDMSVLESFHMLQRSAAPFVSWDDPLSTIVFVVNDAGALYGACDVRGAVRRAVLPDSASLVRSPMTDKQLRRASSSAAVRPRHGEPADDEEDVRAGASDDEDLADIGSLMLQPREANAVPWSQRYAHTRF
jgi:hypothetical protein